MPRDLPPGYDAWRVGDIDPPPDDEDDEFPDVTDDREPDFDDPAYRGPLPYGYSR